jgi:hypothetical protein
MRIVMTFVVKCEDFEQNVLPGPAWGYAQAERLFELMAIPEVVEGQKSLDVVRVGLARARAELEGLPEELRAELARMVDSLGTWATVAKLQGANAVRWSTDF